MLALINVPFVLLLLLLHKEKLCCIQCGVTALELEAAFSVYCAVADFFFPAQVFVLAVVTSYFEGSYIQRKFPYKMLCIF